MAEALNEWLKLAFQRIETFLSDDIEIGRRSLEEIDNALTDSVAAIVVLTPDSAKSPWVAYEVGVIGSRTMPNGKRRKPMCVLVGYERLSDLAGPFTQFQNSLLNEESMGKLHKSLCTEMEIGADRAKSDFDRYWPDLQRLLADKRKDIVATEKAEKRKDREVLDEILELVRDGFVPGRPVDISYTGKVIAKCNAV